MDGRGLDLSWPDDDDDVGFMLPLDDDNLQQLQELQAGRIQLYSNPSPNGQKVLIGHSVCVFNLCVNA